jgi:predicted ATP-grasp superfamily ATP-dependent carboligase
VIQQEHKNPVIHNSHVVSGTRSPTVLRGAKVIRASTSELREVAPVLLARPGYGGTIAAIRDLAQDQIPVAVLAESLLDCGRWSKYVSATIPTGTQADPKALLASLGKLTEAGTCPVAAVLLPSCDSSAWTYAAHSDKLTRHFRLYAPPFETMNTILDKGLFETACTHAAVPVLKSWTVKNEGALAQVADTLQFPLIIKPRTHVRRRRNDKGEVVANHDQLVRALRRIGRSDRFYDAEGDHDNNQEFFLQQFVDVFPRGVLSVTGFIDRSGTHFVARAARKVLLRSEPAGVGVCFESTPLDPALAEQTARLCRNLRYFGVFEVEFIWDGSRWAAIDFNPRFFNQMALDIARGLPLARLCYYDAIGDSQRLSALLEQALAAAPEDKLCMRDGFTMALVLTFRRLTGRMSRSDRLGWHKWSRSNRGGMKDLIRAGDDPWVWPVHMMSEVMFGLRKLFNLAKARFTDAGQWHA